MHQQFTVVDFETANTSRASICQIGVANFADGIYVDGWVQLINPQDEFSGMNISVHGIHKSHVCDSPTFPAVYARLVSSLTNTVAVSHGEFDKSAFAQVCAKYGLPVPQLIWLDTTKVVRKCWPEKFGQKGYGLTDQAKYHGIVYAAHDALEDARCAGEVLLRAISETGLSAAGWIGYTGPATHTKVELDGDPKGVFFGEVLVFTGSIAEGTRAIAAAAGYNVAKGVTKQTTILVDGYQDPRKLGDHGRSSSHSKAEKWIAKGHPLRIVSELNFLAMISAN